MQLPVILKDIRGDNALLTDNINRTGIFLRTDTPKPIRQLIAFSISMPPDDEQLTLHGMVIYSNLPEQSKINGRPPGMGIKFYGMGGDIKNRWEAYYQKIKDIYDEERPDNNWLDSSLEIEADNREFPRYKATFKVVLKSVKTMFEFLSKDISLGGMFLKSEYLLEKDDEVLMEIIHPLNNKTFPLSGRIVRLVPTPPEERGMGIQFLNMDQLTIDKFWHFIEKGIPEMEEFDPFPEEDGLSFLELG